MTRYSRRPGDVATVRTFLVQVAETPDASLPTYAVVASQYGGIARAVAPILNSIARDCAASGEPDLSALVVDRTTGLARTFNESPVEPGTASEGAWRDELDRIRSHCWRA